MSAAISGANLTHGLTAVIRATSHVDITGRCQYVPLGRSRSAGPDEDILPPHFASAAPAILSKMVRNAGCRVVGKTFVSGANQDFEIGIDRRAETGSCAWPDLVPADAIEPANLVGATADRQDHGGRKPVEVVAIGRELQAFD